MAELSPARVDTVDRREGAEPAPSAGTAAEALLTAVPGIGAHYAQALLQRFGGVEAVLAASDEELREVPGIGPARVRALRETLGGE